MTDLEKQLKLHRFIESIKQQEFPFDTHDVNENVDQIVDYYGRPIRMTDEDMELLKEELAKLAEEEQTSEIASKVEEFQDPLLAGIMNGAKNNTKGERKW